LIYLRTLCKVWSLVRHRVTRRLTRLQTMYNVLKYCKKRWNNDKNQFTVTGVHRTGTWNIFNLIMRMTVQLLYQYKYQYPQYIYSCGIFLHYMYLWASLRWQLSSGPTRLLHWVANQHRYDYIFLVFYIFSSGRHTKCLRRLTIVVEWQSSIFHVVIVNPFPAHAIVTYRICHELSVEINSS